jgi:GxxExxY protein
MSELLYNEETYKIIGLCMEVHRELGKGYDEVTYKDALEVECRRGGVPFAREVRYEVESKGLILPHFYYADFVIFDKILFEGKACECLTEAHVKQVLNYLAASKLEIALLVNFKGNSLTWKRIIRSEGKSVDPSEFRK